MSIQSEYEVEFSRPYRQIVFMIAVLVLTGIGILLLGPAVRTVFFANVWLNGFIIAVFALGVAATFWQVGQIIAAINWLRNMKAGHMGHEFVRPPRLLAGMAPMVREGQVKKRMAASSTRSILDSIAVRLDEARDITRYITNLLIFLGLLGTFWGLAQTVPAVVDTIRSLAPEEGELVFDNLMTGLEDQLGGMGTAFASSLIGLAGSLVVGLLELFAGHGQNRFYNEVEEWLVSFTRLGLISEGEGPDNALVALLERVDEGLEKTTEFATRAEEARVKAETRLAAAADVVADMVGQIDKERELMVSLLTEIREARDHEVGRDHATLTVLKRIDQSQTAVANGQVQMVQALERAAQGSGNGELGGYLASVEQHLRLMADDISVGRQESTRALRQEIRALTRMIDERTQGPGGR
ncbi:MAG TPA: biopolymer transporter ExbB [Thermohalobaculum sp.]|nr:biopolymer transporter ExbB [Thermohalobaculum sp.]